MMCDETKGKKLIMTTRITDTCLVACAALMLALNLPAAESGIYKDL